MNSKADSDSTFRELCRLLEDWKKLTEAEKDSIDREDWARLRQLQTEKQASQRLIQQSEDALFGNEALLPQKQVILRQHLRQMAEELLRLEETNRETITKKMASTNSQSKLSEKAIRSLRHVQQAYGTGTRSFWHAYS